MKQPENRVFVICSQMVDCLWYSRKDDSFLAAQERVGPTWQKKCESVRPCASFFISKRSRNPGCYRSLQIGIEPNTTAHDTGGGRTDRGVASGNLKPKPKPCTRRLPTSTRTWTASAFLSSNTWFPSMEVPPPPPLTLRPTPPAAPHAQANATHSVPRWGQRRVWDTASE